ncbi:MAG: heavy metal translocating P-type ATPase [Pseudomonadota bacterium]
MSVVACPGCAAGPPAAAAAAGRLAAPVAPTHHLVLPRIHCAGCIRTVETTLTTVPGIRAARVNLTRRRAAITADPGADPGPWIRALAAAGVEAHEASEPGARLSGDLLPHLGVAGFAMMNVMLLSVAVWSGAADSTRDLLHWVSAAIALPATAFAAQPFFRNAWGALRVARLNMDVPISLAILLACGMSLFEVAFGGAHAWFDAALALTFFLLLGRVLDQRLRQAAKSAADDLAALEPSRVDRIEPAGRVSRPVAEIAIGDRLWLAAGGRVPVDATLLDGPVQIDRSFLTGESDPVTRHPGADLHAGEICLTGPITLRATAVGEDTTLRRISQLVATAEGARGRFRSLADRAAGIYTPMVHIVSALAFTGWLVATGDVRMALNVAIATLIITCPCALGLAVPAVAVAATSRLYRAGLLVKSDTALERLAGVGTVVFDKTGTLSQRTLLVPERASDAQRRVLRALADASSHPLCRRLAASLADTAPVALHGVCETAGQGVRAVWNGQPVSLGRDGPGAPDTVFVCGTRRFVLRSVETLLPDAAQAVAALHGMGLKTCMLTGDTAANAAEIAQSLGIGRVWAGVGPAQKVDLVTELRAGGETVLMVGDGLNDTAALAAAEASIAPGAALDASRNAADIVIVSGQLTKIAPAIAIARRARRRILQNFAIAASYNAIAIPVAVLGFATPLAAAIAMSTSSITVVMNALRGMRQ